MGSEGQGRGTERTNRPIIIVQGGQWGSEAKGLITHKLTLEKKVDVAIRTGTVNAGHTVYYCHEPYAMQQLPVSWVRPATDLVLGPGAYIHPDILAREIQLVMDAMNVPLEDVLERLYIDYRCGIHTSIHTDRAKAADRHHKIGTTGKGCSEAVVEKIMGRSSQVTPTFLRWTESAGGFWRKVAKRIVDTVSYVNKEWDAGQQLLVEGTQGTLLDLHLGDYPYTTHKQTQAASWLAEAGLSCTLPIDLWSVMRTYPIKVAGNSGPMPGETSWMKVARNMADAGVDRVPPWALSQWHEAIQKVMTETYPEAPRQDPAWWSQLEREQNRVAASEAHKLAFDSLPPETQQELCRLFEFTTVTKKLRRVADWDWPTAYRSLTMNRPTHIALTFANYKWPTLWGATKFQATEGGYLWREWVEELNRKSAELGGGPVGIVSFGPQVEHTHMADDLCFDPSEV